VRYITLAFAAIAALGRLGIETSSIIIIGAAGLARWGLRCRDRYQTLPLAYC
jgi:small-conductance mechanosensitive channel